MVDSRGVTTTDSKGRKLDRSSRPPNDPVTTAGPCLPRASASEQLGRRIDLPVNKGGHPDSVGKRMKMEASDSSANARGEDQQQWPCQ